jgi:hypothetical protein
MYVTDIADVQVLTYPGGKLIGTIPLYGPTCTDPKNGDFYISNGDSIEKFKAGKLTASATLNLPSGAFASGCSVDPTTGNAAFSMSQGTGSSAAGYVAVYSSLNAPPTTYGDGDIKYSVFCGYDRSGDLFISVNKVLGAGPVQWDGTYMAVQVNSDPPTIYQISVSGLTGTVIGTTILDRHRGKHIKLWGNMWIQGSTVLYPQGGRRNANVGFYHYPQGGGAYKKLNPDPKAKGKTFVTYISVSNPGAN